MKEKILALLTAKFSGVRKDGLKVLASTLGLQCTTDDEAKALVEKITDAQVNDFIKDYRADVDKEMSESNKTLESNLRKKYDFKEKETKTEPGGDPNPDPKPNDISAIVKAAVAEAVKPFQEKLSGYETDNIAKARLQALEEKLATCKDETFKEQTKKDFARMSFDDDNAFNEYLNEKVADIDKANQNLADKKLGGVESPLFGNKSKDGISQGVTDFLESQKPDAEKSLGGKEL